MLAREEEWDSQIALVVKDSPANAEVVRDPGSIPVSGRCPGGGHGTPFQYSVISHGQRSLTSYSPWDDKVSGKTEMT